MEELIYSIDWEQVKNRFDIFMWGDPNIPIVKAVWANIAIAAVGLIMNVAQSLSAKKRRQKAMNEYKQSKAAFEAQDITNPYKDLENPYEDLTVNQKQAQFMAQQTQQGLANQMQALRGAAGASGISGLAQAIANQRTRNLQGISGTIGQQEAQNERLKAQGALQTKLAKAQGEQQMEMFQAQKAGTMLGMSQANVAGATMQQQAALGGIAHSIGSLGGAIEGHVEQQKLKTDLDKTNLPTTGKTGVVEGFPPGVDYGVNENPAGITSTAADSGLGNIENLGSLGNITILDPYNTLESVGGYTNTTGGLLGGNTGGLLSGPENYEVKQGDYLTKIANDHGMTLPQLLALNTDLNINSVLQPKQEIRIK